MSMHRLSGMLPGTKGAASICNAATMDAANEVNFELEG